MARGTNCPSRPTRAVGSRIKRPTEKKIPSTTATVTNTEAAFSLPRCLSSHCSNLEGSSGVSSSSGIKEAEYISALTPLAMEEQKLNTPRRKGNPKTGCLSLMSTRSSTCSANVPSGLRTTTAFFSGPSIMIPSIRAWPPIIVLYGVAQQRFF